MSPAEEVARYLADNAIGTLAASAGWGVFFSRMPDEPDTAICCIDSGGSGPLVYDEEIREPSIEIRIRGTDPEANHDKAEEIFALLCETGGIPGPARTIGDGLYFSFWMDSDFIDLGRDENERHRVTSNYRCNRQPSEVISS